MAYTGLGKIALSKTRGNPYNMHMKNTKAVFLIILGSFLLATGFAYAKEDGPAMQKLIEISGDSVPAVDTLNAAGVKNTGSLNKGATGVNLTAAIQQTANKAGVVAPAVSSAPAPKEEKKPTMGETVKKWIGDNFSPIIAAVAIGFLGFLMIGTGIGGLLVGAAALGFFLGLKKL